MTPCQAPYRLPDDYFKKLEALSPEEAAVTYIGEVLADDHDCGDASVDTVSYAGREIAVCQWHKDWFYQNLAKN
jgi:hypothetical protein